jgi:hypothetical protein
VGTLLILFAAAYLLKGLRPQVNFFLAGKPIRAGKKDYFLH